MQNQLYYTRFGTRKDKRTMDRTLSYTIEAADDGENVGEYLRHHGYSQPLLIHLKKTQEGILLNGIWCYVNSILHTGDILTIHIQDHDGSTGIPATEISEEAFTSMVAYEDEDILVMNKPADLPVHPSLGHYEDTLANYCAWHYHNQLVFRCVNRLDRDTSGLVLIAKNMLSAAGLSLQQQAREIHRTYLAIVEGIIPEEGTIDLPIARKEDSIIERCVDGSRGECAITHYCRISTTCLDGCEYSLVQIQLETGRTHQIRVHMKAIGHPLPGDFLYNPNYRHIKRQALHSYRLEFTHPISGKALSFTQNIPSDFESLFPKIQ